MVNIKSTWGGWRDSRAVKYREEKLESILYSNALLKQESRREKREIKLKIFYSGKINENRVYIKAKEREMHVAAMDTTKEKSDKSRSPHIAVWKQYKDNDTKVKAEFERMIHQHHIQSIANIY